MAGGSHKSLCIAYIWWFFLGLFGAHRFYLEKYITGAIWLITGGICGIGWFVDLFVMPCMTAEANNKEKEPQNVVYQVVYQQAAPQVVQAPQPGVVYQQAPPQGVQPQQPGVVYQVDAASPAPTFIPGPSPCM